MQNLSECKCSIRERVQTHNLSVNIQMQDLSVSTHAVSEREFKNGIRV